MLNFEHGLGNSNKASYLAQTQTKWLSMYEKNAADYDNFNVPPPPPRLFQDRENPLEEFPEQVILQRYRFSPDTIMFMMTIVGEAASETTRNCALPPLMKLLLCLRYLASGTFRCDIDPFTHR